MARCCIVVGTLSILFLVSQSAIVGKKPGRDAYIAVWFSPIFHYQARLLLGNVSSDLQRFPLRLLSWCRNWCGMFVTARCTAITGTIRKILIVINSTLLPRRCYLVQSQSGLDFRLFPYLPSFGPLSASATSQILLLPLLQALLPRQQALLGPWQFYLIPLNAQSLPLLFFPHTRQGRPGRSLSISWLNVSVDDFYQTFKFWNCLIGLVPFLSLPSGRRWYTALSAQFSIFCSPFGVVQPALHYRWFVRISFPQHELGLVVALGLKSSLEG